MEHVQVAISRGLSALGFSEHADLDPDDANYGFLDLDAIGASIQRAREAAAGRLAVRWGIEVDYRPHLEGSIANLLENFPGDYAIGSVHFVDGRPLYSHRTFVERPLAEVYAAYRDACLALIRTGWFDVLGHLDFPRRYAHAAVGDPWPDHVTAPFLEDVLSAVARSDMLLEVNTAGLRKDVGHCSPSLDLVERFADLGGTRVVLGSDAHAPRDVGSHTAEIGARCERFGLEVVDPATLGRRPSG